MGKELLEQRSGIRLNRPGGTNLRLDWLLSRDSKGVREVWKGKDRRDAIDRRFVALDGLGLAHGILTARDGRMLYAAPHTVYTSPSDARTAAFYFSGCSLGIYKDTRQLRDLEANIVAPPCEAGDPWRLADDLYNTGVVAELKPDWQCNTKVAPDDTAAICESTLDLGRALHPGSWQRLIGRLDLVM